MAQEGTNQEELVKAIYYRVIAIASHFLEEARYLSVEGLRDVDPTVAHLAKTMRMLASVLKDLAGESWDDEKMAHNALQCCLVMERLADVVAKDGEDELGEVLTQLETHTNVP